MRGRGKGSVRNHVPQELPLDLANSREQDFSEGIVPQTKSDSRVWNSDEQAQANEETTQHVS